MKPGDLAFYDWRERYPSSHSPGVGGFTREKVVALVCRYEPALVCEDPEVAVEAPRWLILMKGITIYAYDYELEVISES